MAEKFINQERLSELWGKIKILLGNKVDKVAGKGLSTEDYTTAEKTKLAGVATGANNYTHPANHPPSIITQDASNRFVTDTQIGTWNSKANASHTHTKANITDFPESMPPTSHTHGNISNDGKIGTTPDLPVFTGAGGALTAKAISDAQALLGIELGAAKIATGSYTGTGTYWTSGGENRSKLVIPKGTKLLYIIRKVNAHDSPQRSAIFRLDVLNLWFYVPVFCRNTSKGVDWTVSSLLCLLEDIGAAWELTYYNDGATKGELYQLNEAGVVYETFFIS